MNMFNRDSVLDGTKALDALSHDEYGYGIVELLADPDENSAAYRLRRLTGITLKKPFATPSPIGTGFTASGARQVWTWHEGVAEGHIANTSDPNFEVLDQLRAELPRLSPDYATLAPTWHDLLHEAEHESGLFQVLVHWVDDKLRGRPTQNFASYYVGETDYRLGSVADVAETVFNYSTAPILASFIPGVGLVVPLALIGVRFGLTRMLKAKLANEHDSDN